MVRDHFFGINVDGDNMKIAIKEIEPLALTIPEAAKFCRLSPEYFGKVYDKPKSQGGLDLLKEVAFYNITGSRKGYRLDLKDLKNWYQRKKVN